MIMVTPEEKVVRLEEACRELDELVELELKREIEFAQAERTYRQALAKKQLEFRTRGKNEPAALVLNYAKGDPMVAELRYKRDIAKINVDVLKDTIRNRRLQVEALRTIVSRDKIIYQNT